MDIRFVALSNSCEVRGDLQFINQKDSNVCKKLNRAAGPYLL